MPAELKTPVDPITGLCVHGITDNVKIFYKMILENYEDKTRSTTYNYRCFDKEHNTSSLGNVGTFTVRSSL